MLLSIYGLSVLTIDYASELSTELSSINEGNILFVSVRIIQNTYLEFLIFSMEKQ